MRRLIERTCHLKLVDAAVPDVTMVGLQYQRWIRVVVVTIGVTSVLLTIVYLGYVTGAMNMMVIKDIGNT